jgi:hypothetical protein
MLSVAGVPYKFNKPWPFWFYIRKIISKAFFDDEKQLEWLNAVGVQTREFIAFTNTQINRVSNQETSNIEEAKLRIVEVDFPKPQPGENLKLFGSPSEELYARKSKTVRG